MKVKRSTWFKTFVAFLAFVIVIQMLPLSVFANTNSHKFSESKIDSVISKYNEENKSSNKIITEIKDKRTEYSKTYLLDDNSYYCITVTNPIHYLDEEKRVNLDERLDTIPITTEEAENILVELSNELSQSSVSLFSSGPTQISNNNIITNAINFLPLENDSVNVTNGYQTSARFNGNAYLLVKPSLVYNYSANNLLIENANLCFQISTSNNKELKIKAYEENCVWKSNVNLENSYKNIEGLELLDSTSLLNSQTCKMNITDVFSKWERETLENNGVKLKFDISRDTVTVSDFCISVQYKDLSNDNTNYTYHTLDLGKAGTISINDITNTMTINQDIIGINTNVLPVNISRTINSVLPTLHANGNVSGHWNYGYAIELNDDIMTWRMPDGYSVKYQKIDKDIVNGYQKWEQITDSVAIYSTLWIDTDVDLDEFNMDYSKCHIEDNGSNYIYNFDVDGRLSTIKRNNHKINISYGSRGISQIEDSVGNKYKFTYGQYDIDGVKYYYVSKISAYDASGNVIKVDGEDFDVNFSVEYDSNSSTIVNQEIFSDGATVEYIFDENGNIQKIECSDDSYVEFRYKNKDNNYLVSYEYYSLENGEKIH